MLGLVWQMGHKFSSPVELDDLSLENGRRKFFMDEELRSGRSNSNISCKVMKELPDRHEETSSIEQKKRSKCKDTNKYARYTMMRRKQRRRNSANHLGWDDFYKLSPTQRKRTAHANFSVSSRKSHFLFWYPIHLYKLGWKNYREFIPHQLAIHVLKAHSSVHIRAPINKSCL